MFISTYKYLIYIAFSTGSTATLPVALDIEKAKVIRVRASKELRAAICCL